MFLIYFCFNFGQILKMSLSLLKTLFWRACNLEINWTSTKQRKQGYISDLSLNGSLEMTGKQHVIQKTMIIIIIQQKIFSMFLLQDPSSELAKMKRQRELKILLFYKQPPLLQAQSTWKIHNLYACIHLWSRRFYTFDKLLSLSWRRKAKQRRKDEKAFPEALL